MIDEDYLTESQLRAIVRELLEEMSGADELLAERRRKNRGDKAGKKTGWAGGDRGKHRDKTVVRREGDLEQSVDPNVRDITKLKWKSPSGYASKITSAMSKADGHVPIAAKIVGLSPRQLYRHLHDPLVIAADPERADPGPDPNWDVERGVPESDNEKDAAAARARIRSKSREERENQERERKRNER
jgi:hypothetical protein